MIITPQRMTWQQYRSQLWRSLSKTEGSIRRVYSDGKGIPTIGVGYALVVGKPGSYKILPKNEVPAFLWNKISATDKLLLRRQVRLLNSKLTAQDRRYYQTTMVIRKGKQVSLWTAAKLETSRGPTPPGQAARPILLGKNQINRLARIAIPDVGGRSSVLSGNHNRFSFTLGQGEPRQLFDKAVSKFENQLRRDIRRGHVKVPGVNAATAKRLSGALTHTARKRSSGSRACFA